MALALTSSDSTLTEGSLFNSVITGLTGVPDSAVITGGQVNLTVTSLTYNSGTSTVSFTCPPLPDGNSYSVTYHSGLNSVTTGSLTSSNSYPYSDVPGVVDSGSILKGQSLGNNPVELKIITDADPGIISINWAQMNTDGTWNGGISHYATPVTGVTGSTTIEIGILFSDGKFGNFQVTIIVGSGVIISIISYKLTPALVPSPVPGLF